MTARKNCQIGVKIKIEYKLITIVRKIIANVFGLTKALIINSKVLTRQALHQIFRRSCGLLKGKK